MRFWILLPGKARNWTGSTVFLLRAFYTNSVASRLSRNADVGYPCRPINQRKPAAHQKRNSAISPLPQNNVSNSKPSSPNQTKKSTSQLAKEDQSFYPQTFFLIYKARQPALAQASFTCTKPHGRGSLSEYRNLKRKLNGSRMGGNF